MAYSSWQLVVIDHVGYNCIQEEQLNAVASALRSTGQTAIDRATFDRVCRQYNIDSSNFNQADLDRLQGKLNK
jgi:hypothetical protein